MTSDIGTRVSVGVLRQCLRYVFCGCFALLCATPIASLGQEAQWIWSPQHAQGSVPHTSCYFRKTVQVRSPERGQITIAADDAYELFVNGRRVAKGEGRKRLAEHNVTRFLARGGNTFAIRVENRRGVTAALAARVMIKERKSEWKSYSTNKTWRTSLRPLPLWNTPLYNDQNWRRAQAFGPLGETIPWDREEGTNREATSTNERFKIAEAFDVERVLDNDKTGSLIAMSFNEFGQVIAARENGPLLLIYDSDQDG